MAGLVALRWPVASWLPGFAHKSDVPPVLGVGVLVIPVVLLGLGARRLAEFLAVTLEARRQSRRRSEGRAPTKAVD